MTDTPEPGGPAAPKTVTLSAVAEEMAAEADFHRNRKLLRASQVDELAAHVAQLTKQLEALAPKKAKKEAGNGDPA